MLGCWADVYGNVCASEDAAPLVICLQIEKKAVR